MLNLLIDLQGRPRWSAGCYRTKHQGVKRPWSELELQPRRRLLRTRLCCQHEDARPLMQLLTSSSFEIFLASASCLSSLPETRIVQIRQVRQRATQLLGSAKDGAKRRYFLPRSFGLLCPAFATFSVTGQRLRVAPACQFHIQAHCTVGMMGRHHNFKPVSLSPKNFPNVFPVVIFLTLLAG